MNRSLALAASAAALALSACGGGSDPAPPPPPPPPPVVLTTFQDASVAIGQANLTTVPAATPACDASTLAFPVGACGWDGTHLFVPDTDHQRVLAFTGVPASSGASATLVVGQPNDTDCQTSTVPAIDPTYSDAETLLPQAVRGMPGPSGGDAVLAVADTGSNRVLLHVPSPVASGVGTPIVVGQPDIATFNPGCDASTLNAPKAAIVVGSRLLVADSQNYRVLIWDTLPTADGAPANRVLGQANLTSCSPPSTTSASTLSFPADVWSDGVRVAVVDADANRVLLWSAFPASDGVAATGVVGQADFTSANPNRGGTADAGTLDNPQSVATDGTQLAVADYGNSRVLLYPTLPVATAGSSANVVLGQGDFTHVKPNDANQDGTADAAPAARTLQFPTGVAFIDGALLVTDYGNDRILVFRPAP